MEYNMKYDDDKFLDVSTIIKIMNKHFKKGLTTEDVVSLIKETYQYCASWYGKTNYPLPKLIIDDLDKVGSKKGSYNVETNTIKISMAEVQKLVNSKDKSSAQLIDIINYTAHEMRHYKQTVLADKYDSLPKNSKTNISEYVRDLLISQKNKNPNTDKTAVASFMNNYLDEKPKFDTKNKDIRLYFMLAREGLYKMYPIEKDARLVGAQITNMIALQCMKDKNASKETIEYLKNNQKRLVNDLEDAYDRENIEIAKDFLKIFDEKYMKISIDGILKMATDFDKPVPEGLNEESRANFKNKQEVYIVALGYIMKNKSTEEKKELFEKATEGQYKILKNITEQSLALDAHATKNYEAEREL